MTVVKMFLCVFYAMQMCSHDSVVTILLHWCYGSAERLKHTLYLRLQLCPGHCLLVWYLVTTFPSIAFLHLDLELNFLYWLLLYYLCFHHPTVLGLWQRHCVIRLTCLSVVCLFVHPVKISHEWPEQLWYNWQGIVTIFWRSKQYRRQSLISMGGQREF